MNVFKDRNKTMEKSRILSVKYKQNRNRWYIKFKVSIIHALVILSALAILFQLLYFYFQKSRIDVIRKTRQKIEIQNVLIRLNQDKQTKLDANDSESLDLLQGNFSKSSISTRARPKENLTTISTQVVRGNDNKDLRGRDSPNKFSTRINEHHNKGLKKKTMFHSSFTTEKINVHRHDIKELVVKTKAKVQTNSSKSKKVINKNHDKELSTNIKPRPNLTKTVEIIQTYHRNTIQYRDRFDCSAIINGSNVEIQNVRKFLRVDRPKNGYDFMKLERVREMFTDCENFKKIRGYILDEGSPVEKENPLAFVILAHQDFDHLERLFRVLYRPQHTFCVHLDKKVADDLKKAVSGLASCFPNLLLASEPQSIVYASMSRLKADYICMKDLVNQKRPWKYLINLAATSFPLKTNQEIVKHIKSLKGENDISMRFKRIIPRRWAVEYYTEHGRIRASNTKLAPPPHNLTVIKGMAYNTLSREFVQWVMKDSRALDFFNWCNKTYSPDEHYWATLNNLYHNPSLRTPGGYHEHPDKHRDMTFIAKFASKESRCKGREIHRTCLFVSGDLAFLRMKSWFLTANKFDLKFDPVAYSCMEEWIHNRTMANHIT